jgi:hypothetical protein
MPLLNSEAVCRHQVHQQCEKAPLGPKKAASSSQRSAVTGRISSMGG